MMMITKDAPLEVKNLSATGVFSGYGSVFDNADMGDDIVTKGAFTESLTTWSAKGSLPALLWQHKASEPIGAYTRMSEDSRGLYVEGQLAMKTQRGSEAYDLLKMKAISGLSIGFITKDDAYDQKTGVRTIKKLDLWEVSLVTFPMNPDARVADVKSVPEFESIADFERYLRDTGPYSRNAVMTLMKKAKRLFQRDTGVSDDEAKSILILKALKTRSNLLTTKAMAGDSEVDEPPGPDPDDDCTLDAGCCMPDGCCNSMGCCMAKAIGARGPMP